VHKLKNFKLLGTILFTSALIISGCGNDSADVVDNGKRDEPLFVNKPDVEGGSLEHGDGYGFREFDLEIDINGKDAIDVDYNVTKNAEAEYKNELTNVNVEGAKAMNEVDKLFMDILITKDTPEDVVIEKVLEFLRVETYSKFELEVDFVDGTKLDIKDKK